MVAQHLSTFVSITLLNTQCLFGIYNNGMHEACTGRFGFKMSSHYPVVNLKTHIVEQYYVVSTRSS
jgi:hypothetical protein